MDLSVNDTIMYITKAQILKVMNEKEITDYDIYDSITFKGEDATKAITIIVELSDGTIYNNSTSVDIKIKAISDVDTAKGVLDRYGQEFTLTESLVTITNAFIQQSYTTPVVDKSFEEIDHDLKSTVSIEGTFIVGLDIYSVESIVVDDEEIDVIDFGYDFKASPNPQAFVSTQSRTMTKNTIGSLSVHFIQDSGSSDFLKKVVGISLGTDSLNSKFNVVFSLGDIDLELNTKLKLIADSYSQKKGKIPAHSITLAR